MTPEAEPIDATAGVPLYQTPPGVLHARPTTGKLALHIEDGPVIDAGAGSMVTVVDVKALPQLSTIEYVKVTTPGATPEAIPLEEPIVATVTSDELHVPPTDPVGLV
jgi:hypothetical protein